MPNKILGFTDLDKHREKEARKNPLYNPDSHKWVVNVINNQEVSAIRQNFRHGFISWGWEDFNQKWILGVVPSKFDCPNKKERDKILFVLKRAAQAVCIQLNKELDLF